MFGFAIYLAISYHRIQCKTEHCRSRFSSVEPSKRQYGEGSFTQLGVSNSRTAVTEWDVLIVCRAFPMFDSIMISFSEKKIRLHHDSNIVVSPSFESPLVKLRLGEDSAPGACKAKTVPHQKLSTSPQPMVQADESLSNTGKIQKKTLSIRTLRLFYLRRIFAPILS